MKLLDGITQFTGYKLGQTLGDGERQGSLVSCSLWGGEESDTTWQLNNNNSTCEKTFTLTYEEFR